MILVLVLIFLRVFIARACKTEKILPFRLLMLNLQFCTYFNCNNIAHNNVIGVQLYQFLALIDIRFLLSTYVHAGVTRARVR